MSRDDPWDHWAMRIVHARRPGGPPLGGVPTIRRALLRVLAVGALIAGIVAMHSLGLGHGPMTTGHSGHSGHSGDAVMAEATKMVGMSASPAALAMTRADGIKAPGHPGHGMAAMCLAVLPLVVLLLARLLGWRVRSLAHAVRRRGGGGFVPGNRAPPALMCPSLLKLGILRT